MDDVMLRAVAALLPGGATRGELAFGQRRLRWVEAGTGGPTVVLDAASGPRADLAADPAGARAAHQGHRVRPGGFGASDQAVTDAVLAVVEKARLGHGA
ncbi:hypothetical protein ACFQZ4_08610 [Catellatospora coxensis]